MIAIVDYGMGNLRSVQKAFERVGAQAIVLHEPDQTGSCCHLVLPGVGAFADGMDQLKRRGWPDAIRSFVASGRPFFGVCLGMQLLFDSSEENAASADQPVGGLGLLPGQVVRFTGPAYGPGKLKVPHMGWNTLKWDRHDPLLRKIQPGSSVYFVHSYHAVPATDRAETIISARTDYGVLFCASLWCQNVWATQFHPEKSQRVGLAMLSNFAALTECSAVSWPL